MEGGIQVMSQNHPVTVLLVLEVQSQFVHCVCTCINDLIPSTVQQIWWQADGEFCIEKMLKKTRFYSACTANVALCCHYLLLLLLLFSTHLLQANFLLVSATDKLLVY